MGAFYSYYGNLSVLGCLVIFLIIAVPVGIIYMICSGGKPPESPYWSYNRTVCDLIEKESEKRKQQEHQQQSEHEGEHGGKDQ